jgi:hypothetical protein
MSRDDGFTVADMDSGYFEDAKMRALWQALRDPDRMARAICLHAATTLASWRQGCRVTVAQAIPLWLPMDADLIATLKGVKLLDRAGKVPKESWQIWFGTAFTRRETRREAGRIGGLASAQHRALPGEAPVKRPRKHPSTVAEPDRPSVLPSVPPDPAVPPAAGGATLQGKNGTKRGSGQLQADMAALGISVPEALA